MWDTETGQPEWVSLLISDGNSVTFSTTGDILDGAPEVIEREIVYVVEQPDGRTKLYKPSEFQKLVDNAKASQE